MIAIVFRITVVHFKIYAIRSDKIKYIFIFCMKVDNQSSTCNKYIITIHDLQSDASVSDNRPSNYIGLAEIFISG